MTTQDTITKQEILDAVVKHMMTQRRQALNAKGNCVYLTPEGLKCNMGALFREGEYDPRMDWINNSSVKNLHRAGMLPERFVPHVEFLTRLQSIHDDNGVRYRDDEEPDSDALDFSACRQELAELAVEYGLTFDAENFK